MGETGHARHGRAAAIAALMTALVGATVLSASPALDQPPREGATEPRGEGPRRPGRMGSRGGMDEGPPETADGFRAFLEQRLEHGKKEEGRIREALDRLAKGDPPSEVIREFRREGESRFRQLRDFMETREGRGPGIGGPGPDGEPMDGPGPRGGPPTPLSPEERDRLIDAIKADAPVLADRLSAMRSDDPESVDRMMSRMGQRIREAVSSGKRDPQLFRLKLREIEDGMLVMEAARARRALIESNADQSRIDESTRELRRVVVRQLDSRLAAQSHEIDMLESRLKQQKSALEKQRAEREQKADEILQRIFQEPKHDGPPKDGPSRK